MKKDELFDYLVNRLLKNKTFLNMDKTIVEDEVEKLIREQGSYERNLFELYTRSKVFSTLCIRESSSLLI